jgi:hypothetical protein
MTGFDDVFAEVLHLKKKEKLLNSAIDLMKDVMQGHRDVCDPTYNACEHAPCQWCIEAERIIASSESS